MSKQIIAQPFLKGAIVGLIQYSDGFKYVRVAYQGRGGRYEIELPVTDAFWDSVKPTCIPVKITLEIE